MQGTHLRPVVEHGRITDRVEAVDEAGHVLAIGRFVVAAGPGQLAHAKPGYRTPVTFEVTAKP